jgi:hypothetical protein
VEGSFVQPSVRAAFISFSITFESKLSFMYLDIKNLVTTGIGNLIDPVGLALPLPWTDKTSGAVADAPTITAEWNTVKSRTDLSPSGGAAFGAITTLQLGDSDVNNLVLSQLDNNESTLKAVSEFSGYDGWPADAQLGLLSMAWAMGPNFAPGFPSFRAACAAATVAVEAGDLATAASAWNTAAVQSHMDDSANPGLTPRNTADNTLFTNASKVIATGLDPSVLQYPTAL